MVSFLPFLSMTGVVCGARACVCACARARFVLKEVYLQSKEKRTDITAVHYCHDPSESSHHLFSPYNTCESPPALQMTRPHGTGLRRDAHYEDDSDDDDQRDCSSPAMAAQLCGRALRGRAPRRPCCPSCPSWSGCHRTTWSERKTMRE